MIYNLLVVGAGASGLCAAISAARTHKNFKIALIERMPRAGKKILATGNGRCNLTNLDAQNHDYKNLNFAVPALKAYPVTKTLDFFKGLGLLTFSDEVGRVYPLTNKANAVSDALRFELERLGIPIFCDTPVQKIKLVEKGLFVLDCEDKPSGKKLSFRAKNLIIATGGKAAPVQGSDGSGFSLLSSLGHTIRQPLPSLVPLFSDSPYPKQLKGLRVRSTLTLEIKGKPRAVTHGELLFTDYGLFGIAAMEISPLVSEHFAFSQADCHAVLDLVPSFDHEELFAFLQELTRASESLPLEKLFFGVLPGPLGSVICKECGMKDLQTPLGSLKEQSIKKLVDCAKAFRLKLTGTQGFSRAQVTRGGAAVDEFDPKRLASNKIKGLYACGEVLDVDGACGGYNLQWAWSSGLLAGRLG